MTAFESDLAAQLFLAGLAGFSILVLLLFWWRVRSDIVDEISNAQGFSGKAFTFCMAIVLVLGSTMIPFGFFLGALRVFGVDMMPFNYWIEFGLPFFYEID